VKSDGRSGEVRGNWTVEGVASALDWTIVAGWPGKAAETSIEGGGAWRRKARWSTSTLSHLFAKLDDDLVARPCSWLR
jgi:hypothetical protein